MGLTVTLIETMGTPQLRWPLFTLVAWGGLCLCWYWCLVAQRAPIALLVGVAVATALLAIPASVPSDGIFDVATRWLHVAAATIALGLSLRSARLLIPGLAAAGLVLMGVRVGWAELPALAIQCFDVLAVGMALASAAAAIVVAARRYGRQRLVTEEVRLSAARAKRDEGEAYRVACLLHDTAVNTLGAVARGVNREEFPSLRRRSHNDLLALNRINTERLAEQGAAPSREGGRAERFPQVLVEFVTNRAAALNLQLELELSAAQEWIGPGDVQRMIAVRECISEALLNVAKHARSRAVVVKVDGSPTSGSAEILDNGQNHFHVGTRPSRFTGIAERATRAGLTAEVSNRPSGGVRVVVGWTSEPAQCDDKQSLQRETSTWLSAVVRAMASQVALWLYLLYAAEAVFYYRGVAGWPTLLAVAVAAAVSAAVITAARRRYPVPNLLALVAALAVPLVTYLPAVALDDCASVGPEFWVPNSGPVLVAFVIWFSPRLLFPTLAISGFLIVSGYLLWAAYEAGPGCAESGLSSFLTSVIIIIGCVLIWWFLHRLAGEIDALRVRQGRDADSRISSEHRRLLTTLRSANVLQSALDLLQQIAAGSVDPGSTEVRHQARREETYLRACIAVDPSLGRLGDVLIGAVDTSRAAGVLISVTQIGPVVDVTESGRQGLEGIFTRVIGQLPATSELRVTIGGDDESCITLVADSPLDCDREFGGDLQLEVTDLGDQILVEIRW